MKKRSLAGNALVSGTLLLTAAGILSRFIGFYYKIFLSRTIGANGLGLYQLIFPVFALVLSVTASGIQTAISRFAAGSENRRQAKGYLCAGLALSLALSGLGVVLVNEKADFFCRVMLDNADVADLLRSLSPAIPLAALHACINGYYYGLKKAGIPAASQLIEQLVRVSGVWLIMQIATGEGRTPTVSHAVWGLMIGEAGAALFCVTAMALTGNHSSLAGHKNLAPPSFSSKIQQKKCSPALLFSKALRTIRFYYKNLLTLAVPLTFNRLLTSLFAGAEALLIPLSLSAFGYSDADALSVYGILTGMVFSTIMFPAVISNSLSVMLLPVVSSAKAAGRGDLIRRAVRRTVESCLIFGLICTLGFLLCGNRIGVHLFHNTLAGVYLETLSWICPFVFLGSTLTSVLHGLGRANITLGINLAASLVRIAFICFGVPAIGLKAYLWGMLASQIFAAAAAYLCIRRFGAKK